MEAAQEPVVAGAIIQDSQQPQGHEDGSAEDQEQARPVTKGEQAQPANRTSNSTAVHTLASSAINLPVSSPAATTSDDVLRAVNAPGYEPVSDEKRGKDREEALKQLEGR